MIQLHLFRNHPANTAGLFTAQSGWI